MSGANKTAVNFTATSTQSAQIVPCPPSGTTDVSIQEFSYTQPNVTISPNGIVKWTNNGLIVHTVTSGTTPTPDGKFDSGNMAPGATVCVRFLAPGTYPYFCIPHPTLMIGSVTVSSSSGVVTRFASLDNTQETTGSTSTGKGGGVLTVDTATGKIAGYLVHNVADATRAHIHLGIGQRVAELSRRRHSRAIRRCLGAGARHPCRPRHRAQRQDHHRAPGGRNARAAGRRTGWSCTEGVCVDGEPVGTGDFSGPEGARQVVRDPRVDTAVLETARGGMLRRGLAIERADVAVVTNIAADHFGEFGVHDLAALTETKLVIARAIGPGGRLVLNAEDPHLTGAAASLRVPVAWFGIEPDGDTLSRASRAGQEIATVHDPTLVLHRGAETT